MAGHLLLGRERIWVAFVSECSSAGQATNAGAGERLETGLARPRPTTSWLYSFCVYRNLGESVTIGYGNSQGNKLCGCLLRYHGISPNFVEDNILWNFPPIYGMNSCSNQGILSYVYPL